MESTLVQGAMKTKYTEQQFDALREMSSIGMGHAATALSQLMGRTIYIKVPHAEVLDFSQTHRLLSEGKGLVVAISLQILGDARGTILLIFPMESAFKMLETLLSQKQKKNTLLTEMELSSLKEVGNILGSTFLNALGTLLNMTLIPSIPQLCFDEAETVVGHILEEIGVSEELSVLAETEFHCGEHYINGHLFLLPELNSLDAILHSVGIGTA